MILTAKGFCMLLRTRQLACAQTSSYGSISNCNVSIASPRSGVLRRECETPARLAARLFMFSSTMLLLKNVVSMSFIPAPPPRS